MKHKSGQLIFAIVVLNGLVLSSGCVNPQSSSEKTSLTSAQKTEAATESKKTSENTSDSKIHLDSSSDQDTMVNLHSESSTESKTARTTQVQVEGEAFELDQYYEIPDYILSYEYFCEDAGDYSLFLYLQAKRPVTNFKYLAITITDYNEDGTFSYTEQTQYQSPYVDSEKPLFIQTTFPGDSPTHAISYVDADGCTYCYGIGMSGMDGSLYLIPFE